MFKSLLFVALCAFVLVDSSPSPSEHEHHERVARQSGMPNPIETGINVASQMAQKAAEAAQRAVDMGKKVMQGVAQGAMGTMKQNPAA